MDKKDIIILAQIGILALLIFSFQIIFEFIESLLKISDSWSYATMIFNPIFAVIIITVVYTFSIGKYMPKIIRTYCVLLYVAIQFVWGNINNAFDIQRMYGTIFTPLFYLAIGLSIVIFTVMYFILTSTIDLTSKMVLGNNKEKEEIKMKRISVNVPKETLEAFEKKIPKVEIYKDELPKAKLKEQKVKLKKKPKQAIKKKKTQKKSVKRSNVKKKKR